MAGEPRAKSWLILVALGALAPLIKQSGTLFWVAILLASPFAHRSTGIDGRSAFRRYAVLLAGAATSAALVWLSLGASLRSTHPTLPLLARPYAQAKLMLGEASGHVVFSPWVYLENAQAYGLLCVILLGPALWLALRSDRVFDRLVAASWLICLVVMHLTWLREVRYLAFLAPLTAVLLVQPLRFLLRSRIAASALLAVLFWSTVAGPLPVLPEAMRIFSGFYRTSPYRALFAPLEQDGQLPRPTFVNWRILSSTPVEQEPLKSDRFHRLFHLARHHVATLYGMALDDLPFVNQESMLRNWPSEPALILISGAPLIHPIAGETPGPAEAGLEQIGYRASSVPVRLTDDSESGGHRETELRLLGSLGSDALVESAALAAYLEDRSFAMLRDAVRGRGYQLERGPDRNQFLLIGYTHDRAQRDWWVRSFHRVSQLTIPGRPPSQSDARRQP